MDFGEKFRIARENRGLTQQRLAEMLDCHRSSIANYEIGRRSIDWLVFIVTYYILNCRQIIIILVGKR